jgi:protein PsiE|tara:strand:+ start:255 stop:683 length:429 start_codon:yes stop_codon:yes gene_type:complete
MNMNETNMVQKFIWFSERAILLTIALATLFATASEIIRIIQVQEVNLSDLFLLFIYAEVLGMVASFYANNRIPVTLPLIIAMTALTRMIILQSKDLNAINIIYEATGILILAVSAYIMTLKDKISLKKLLLREKIDESDIPD